MISLEFRTGRLRGTACGIFGYAADGCRPSKLGRFKLFPEEPADDGDPALEGSNAAELEARARALGATSVTHYYEP